MGSAFNDLREEELLDSCVAYLLDERRLTKAEMAAEYPARNSSEKWDLFRALVNTRPPMSATDEFLVAQDELLQGRIAKAGIVSLESAQIGSYDKRLHLWRGDITQLAVDAIVNAANSQMLGCWVPGHYCIDNAIHTFAGVQLRLECARLMEEQGHEEPTAQAKVTPAYNLPSKWVLHTVGPIASGSPTELHRVQLAQCYRSCLDAAQKLGAESIAFCGISTGVFGFPQDQAAPIAVDTVRMWLKDQPQSCMRVVFNVFSKESEALYSKLLA